MQEFRIETLCQYQIATRAESLTTSLEGLGPIGLSLLRMVGWLPQGIKGRDFFIYVSRPRIVWR